MNPINPLLAFAISLIFFAILLHKRIGLGFSLVSAALLLGILSLDPLTIPSVMAETTLQPITLTLVFATFGIMLLSQLYKETGLINDLNKTLSAILKSPRLILSVIPAIIGLMPVPGGALMSAPLVEAEAKKLEMDRAKKTYVNLWFRHTIFPLYPVSQILILTAALTNNSILTLIFRQIPMVSAMLIIGYIIGLRNVKRKNGEKETMDSTNSLNNVKSFLCSFSPVLTTIILVAVFGLNVAIAAFIGIFVLALISKLTFSSLANCLKNKSLYEVALAAYGALFFRDITIKSGASEFLGLIISSGNVNEFILLVIIPMMLAFALGSPSGGIAISVPILAETVIFTPKNAGLLYSSAYLGYLGAPTHLCLVLTANYFNCQLNKLYKYVVPSLIFSFISVSLTYFVI